MAVLGLGSAVMGELTLIALIAVVLFLVFIVGKTILKFVIGIILNSVLGVISLYILDFVFNMGIPIKVYTVAAAAVFGLPAVGTFVILRLFGIPLV